jgi:hypothetical protein
MKREDVLSGNAGIAGVQWALNSRPARALLRAELKTMLESGWQPGQLRLSRSKFKPARKLSAFYTFPVANPTSGRQETLPLAITWEEQFKPAAYSDDISKMEDEVHARHLALPFRHLVGEIGAWGIRLQVWPLDKKFPQLPRLSDPSHVTAVLQDSGIPAADLPVITPIRYRPGERHVLRYSLAAASKVEKFYAKLYENAQDATRAYRVACGVVDWLAQNDPDFHGIRPAGISTTDAVIFYPHVTGTPLSHLFGARPDRLAQQLRATGAALAALHHGPPELAFELPSNRLEDEVHSVRRAGEHIHVLLPDAAALLLRLLDLILERSTRLAQEPPTFTHSDFKADHILVAPDSLTLIDFDTCALADPALDLGKFMADLEWWYGLQQRNGVEQAKEAFLSGYWRIPNPDRRARAQLYQVLILLKITLRRTRLDNSHWAELTTRMFTRAATLLDHTEIS